MLVVIGMHLLAAGFAGMLLAAPVILWAELTHHTDVGEDAFWIGVALAGPTIIGYNLRNLITALSKLS